MPLTTLAAIELRRVMIRQARSQTAKQQIGQPAQASIPSPDSGKGEAKRSESSIPRACTTGKGSTVGRSIGRSNQMLI
jgi:hypothetical protein